MQYSATPARANYTQQETIPPATILPLGDRNGDLLVLVDDENIRLAAELECQGAAPDYAALADRCARDFRSVDLHVFTVRRLGPGILPDAPQARIMIHHKQVPGKNADVEAAIWLTQQLAPGRERPSHVLLVTGDVDYLALHRLAIQQGIFAGFLAAPGRSAASALHSAPLGRLGADVLQHRRHSSNHPYRPAARRHPPWKRR